MSYTFCGVKWLVQEGKRVPHVRMLATKVVACGDETTYPIVCELYSWNHEDAAVSRLPVIVANERTFTSGAFALRNAGHAEAYPFRLVKGGRVQDGNAVPAGLDLDGEVLLKAHG
jgi:hypothetical protein